MKNRIVLFDSGLGGLTVLKQLVKFLPDAPYLYFADKAALPYGSLTEEEIENRLLINLKEIAQFEPRAVLIACHTASLSAIDLLKETFSFPIFGIHEQTRDPFDQKALAILATETSLHTGYYQHLCKEKDPFTLSCPDLVTIAEEGELTSENAKAAIKKYSALLKKNKCQHLFLGCTHYPIFHSLFEKELKNVQIIDPAIKWVKNLIAQIPPSKNKEKKPLLFYSTSPYSEKKVKEVLDALGLKIEIQLHVESISIHIMNKGDTLHESQQTPPAH